MHGVPPLHFPCATANPSTLPITTSAPFLASFWRSRSAGAKSGTSTSPPVRSRRRGILYERFPEKQSYYENYYECVREENGVRYLSPVAKVLHADAVTDGSDIHAVLNGYVSIGKVRCAPF